MLTFAGHDFPSEFASRPAKTAPRRAYLAALDKARAVCLLLWGLVLAVSASLSASASDALHAGFLFDEFDLTLAPGHRTEALGPFFYSEQKETQRTWAVPPLLSYTRDPATGVQGIRLPLSGDDL